MKILFYILFLTSTAHAYTLNNNFGAAFSKTNLNVRIAGNTTCLKANMSVYDLKDLLTPAVNNFWNRVPTSKLRLSAGDFTEDILNIRSGRLCAPTDDDCITKAAMDPQARGVIPPVEEIIIACNDNTENFNGNNVIAVTIPNNFSGTKIRGAVILINDTQNSTVFANLSESDKISVIAHEIGHAVGLGHSEDTSALMYYKVVDLRRNLGQDDVDGISYLYPVKLDACGLIGSVKTEKSDPQMWQMGIGFFMIFLLGLLTRLFRRT